MADGREKNGEKGAEKNVWNERKWEQIREHHKTKNITSCKTGQAMNTIVAMRGVRITIAEMEKKK